MVVVFGINRFVFNGWLRHSLPALDTSYFSNSQNMNFVWDYCDLCKHVFVEEHLKLCKQCGDLFCFYCELLAKKNCTYVALQPNSGLCTMQCALLYDAGFSSNPTRKHARDAMEIDSD